MDAMDVIYNYFDMFDPNENLHSLMQYLDIDTLVAWFVDEGYIDELDEDEQKIVQEHYDLHC